MCPALLAQRKNRVVVTRPFVAFEPAGLEAFSTNFQCRSL
jgi:hypothetical protein